MKALLFCILALGCFASGVAIATVEDLNPNVKFTIVGSDNFALDAPAQTIPSFAIRVTDAAGAPISGVSIDFFTDEQLCIPLDPHCSLPNPVTYGEFVGGAGLITVITDVDGVARSGTYLGGTASGVYDVAAFVSNSTNAPILMGGLSPVAKFDIQQLFANPNATVKTDGYMSGNWYSPHFPSQGFQLEFTDQGDTLLAIWFTYAPDGTSQKWIYAQGDYDETASIVTIPAVLSSGGIFPFQNAVADSSNIPWGTLTFTFDDCNSGVASWNSTVPGYGSGQMQILRLTRIRGTQCPEATASTKPLGVLK